VTTPATMSSRERALAALNRREPDRVPKNIRMVAALAEEVRRAVGTKDIDGHFGVDIRFAPFLADHPIPDVTRYLGPLPPKASVNVWGGVTVPGQLYGLSSRMCPMRDFTDAAQLETYPFPNLQPKVDTMRERVEAIHAAGLAAVSSYECGPYEQACGLRGQAEFLCDLAASPDFAVALLDRITAIKCRIAKAHAEAGVDVVWTGDDLGTQRQLVFSPATWRRFIRPCLLRIVSAIREVSKTVLIAFHSCGHVEPLAGELADAGVQVLESVQPEANDVALLKREHGRRLAFWGTVGAQSVMPHGSPADVRSQVRERIETVGRGGGLMISPAHTLGPEVPVQNVLAFFAAVEEFGRYG